MVTTKKRKNGGAQNKSQKNQRKKEQREKNRRLNNLVETAMLSLKELPSAPLSSAASYSSAPLPSAPLSSAPLPSAPLPSAPLSSTASSSFAPLPSVASSSFAPIPYPIATQGDLLITQTSDNTIGRHQSASAQLSPAIKLAHWIINRSDLCTEKPIPEIVKKAARSLLERWDGSLLNKSGQHSGSGTCWICGFKIQNGNYWQIEHILGMRPSAWSSTALCDYITLMQGGLTQNEWLKISVLKLDKFKNKTLPLDEIDQILCKVNWICIYNFFYNYAPAHQCCNQLKSSVLETKQKYIVSAQINPPNHIPELIGNKININLLLDAIKNTIKSIPPKQKCNELDLYHSEMTDDWIQNQTDNIMTNYIKPFTDFKSCWPTDVLGAFGQVAEAREFRSVPNREALDKSMIEQLSLPHYKNGRTNRPSLERLAFEIGMDISDLIFLLEESKQPGTPTYKELPPAIKAAYDEMKKLKKFEDEKKKSKNYMKSSISKDKTTGKGKGKGKDKSKGGTRKTKKKL